MKKIILTGGGSAGHVTPNLALVPELQRRGYEIVYIGSRDGIEKGIVEGEGLPYYAIATGKLRRYFSLKNFTDPFRVIKGIGDAKKVLKKEQPALVFAKGGFVSLPVVKAARKLGIPCIIHESDMTPGLANRLCFKDATRILCNFPETLENLPAGTSFVSGCPIRESLKSGSREAALAFTGLKGEKPVMLQIGGSLGSVAINTMIREKLPELLEHFDIVHLTGKGNLDENLQREGYVQYEYVSAEMKDLLALADVVVSRAGANALCELLYLHKPNLLIPLPLSASRGDQILNARSFEKQGFSVVLDQDNMTADDLVRALLDLYENRAAYEAAMRQSAAGDAVSFVCDMIDRLTEA